MDQQANDSVIVDLGVSGISVATATLFTNPIDTVKTRLQLQTVAGEANASKPGLVSIGVKLVQHEGFASLWKGVTPAVARGLVYGGLRLGLYSPVKQVLGGREHNVTFAGKVLAGSLSGGFAAAISSPTELVKTRLQAVTTRVTVGAVVRDVLAQHGMAGLWRGATPGLVRASMLTATQCATYDETKRAVMRVTQWRDGVPTHLASSVITGVAATTVTNPVDVVKTIMFAGSERKGVVGSAAAVWRAEGVAGFFRGWLANCARLGPQTIITFMVAEQLRKRAGLSSL